MASERVGSVAEFLAKVDLESYEGRSRANALCKRFEAVIFIGNGWFVTEYGKWVLTFVWTGGTVGQMVMEGDEGCTAGAGVSLVGQIYGLIDEGWAEVID